MGVVPMDRDIRERLDRIDRDLAGVEARVRGATTWQRLADERGQHEFRWLREDMVLRARLTRRRAMLLEAYRGE